MEAVSFHHIWQSNAAAKGNSAIWEHLEMRTLEMRIIPIFSKWRFIMKDYASEYQRSTKVYRLPGFSHWIKKIPRIFSCAAQLISAIEPCWNLQVSVRFQPLHRDSAQTPASGSDYIFYWITLLTQTIQILNCIWRLFLSLPAQNVPVREKDMLISHLFFVSSSIVLDIFQKEEKLWEENYVILFCLGDRIISRAV